MSTLLEYKCPNCNGALEFDSQTQKMKCEYCEGLFELDEVKAYDEALKARKPENMEWGREAGSEWDASAADAKVYSCQSCGGEVVGTSTTAASECPYCGNPVVVIGTLSGELKPDFVIPFKLDKKAAKEAYLSHLRGKVLLPKVFKQENHIDEIKGIYVPFWLFDTDVDADIEYSATKVRTWSDSKYMYTETSRYRVLRGGEIAFDRVPVDGSSKMPDDLMESVEPYDFSQAVEFQTAYLSGYLADKYDVSADDSKGRANARIKQSTEDAFRSTVNGYTSVSVQNSNIRIQNGVIHYAMYPVWLLNTTWKGKKYLFAMNGQTGKIVGDLPMDVGAFWRWWSLIFVIAGALTFGLQLLFT